MPGDRTKAGLAEAGQAEARQAGVGQVKAGQVEDGSAKKRPFLRRVLRFKPARRFLLRRVIPPIGLALIRSLGWSWRYRVLHRERLDELQATKRPTVAGFFHGRTFPLLGFMSGRGNGRWMVMCSKSLDGDAMATIEQRLGFEVIRGSSGTDGLQAIIDMIRRARTDPGLGSCLAVDGSRGPRGEVQGGVIAIAQRTGGVVLPVTAAAKPALVFKRTWDHTMLPLPFARVVVAIGEPVEVPKTLSTEALAQLCKDVERRMELLQEEADDELAGKRSGPAGPVTAAVGRPDPSGDESAVTR